MQVRNPIQRRVSFVVFLSLVLSVALGAGLLWAEDLTPKDLVAMAKAEITSIDVAKARSILDQGGYLFIDVRELSEYKMGRIPGAINIPRGLVEFNIAAEAPEKDARVVVYCKSGGRSSSATQSLQKLGYTALLNMDGGWQIGLAAAVVLLIAGAVLVAVNLRPIIDFLPMASAAYAKFLCSCLFVGGKSEEQSLIWSRQIVPAGEIDIDYTTKTVTVKALGQTKPAAPGS